jgi:peptidoglycan/LPS O-acetylase OafA/YrhL
LVALSRGDGQLSKRILSWPPIVFLGTFAYSIYLTHAFTLQLVTQYGVRPLHLAPIPTVMLTIVAGTLVSVPVAYLFFLGAERPFLNSKPVK